MYLFIGKVHRVQHPCVFLVSSSQIQPYYRNHRETARCKLCYIENTVTLLIFLDVYFNLKYNFAN